MHFKFMDCVINVLGDWKLHLFWTFRVKLDITGFFYITLSYILNLKSKTNNKYKWKHIYISL